MGITPPQQHRHSEVDSNMMADENKDVSMLDVRDASKDDGSPYEGTDSS